MATVTKTNATNKKTSSELDLFSDVDVPRSARSKIKNEVGELLKDQILLAVGNTRSPISGEGWPSLSKDYRKFKQSQNLPGKANMEFSGDMLDNLEFRETSKGIEIGVFGPDAKKADGHNNFSGQSDLPQRRFLPGEGQRFKRDIQSRIDQIIADAVSERSRINRSRLQGISTKSGLFELLESEFQGLSRSQIRSAILSNDRLLQLFESLNLLRFLT